MAKPNNKQLTSPVQASSGLSAQGAEKTSDEMSQSVLSCLEQLEQDRELLRLELAELREKMRLDTQNERMLIKRIDALTVEIIAVTPKSTGIDEIQRYIKRQVQVRHERAEAQQQILASGLDVQDIMRPRSPLDRALSANRSRGTNRPQYPRKPL